LGSDDNSAEHASMIYPDSDKQVHNYCNPLSGDYQDDEDWIKLSVQQGKQYFIHIHANSIQSATILSLFADDGTTLISEPRPDKFGASTYLFWTPDHDQDVYLRLMHLDGRVIGSVVSNTVSVSTGPLIFIPFISK
jgi:hypothetical protein